jgi:serine/threonine protein kinase
LADETSRRRFEQEARIGARIPSEHVVEVQAAGVDGQTGLPYLVMELLEGENLEAMLRRRGPFAPAEVRVVMEQVCHAVGSAHQAGIVHRDLKPLNVFMARARRTGAAFTVKVLDYEPVPGQSQSDTQHPSQRRHGRY